MILNVAYKKESFINSLKEALKEYDIVINSYNEDIHKERSKSFKLKGGYSDRLTPFAVLLDDKKVIKAFYSEASECTIDNIINTIKLIKNESTSI